MHQHALAQQDTVIGAAHARNAQEALLQAGHDQADLVGVRGQHQLAIWQLASGRRRATFRPDHAAHLADADFIHQRRKLGLDQFVNRGFVAAQSHGIGQRLYQFCGLNHAVSIAN